jgi:hypothetical protein
LSLSANQPSPSGDKNGLIGAQYQPFAQGTPPSY